MNKELIDKIITLCYKKKLKYDDNNSKVKEMYNYLIYLDSKDSITLNACLRYILYLTEDKNSLLVPNSVYNIVEKKFELETISYYQQKLAKEFMESNSD